MNLKKTLFAATLASLLLGTAGCIFTSNAYVENEEFDLELPEKVAEVKPIRLGVFKNLSGSDRRFALRREDGQVVSLEYQRWRLSPELMLMRCMYGRFRIWDQESSAALLVSAVLYRFEFDEKENKACLAADFTIMKNQNESIPAVRINVAVPVKDSGDQAAARAKAMSECAAQALDKLAGALKGK